MAVSETLTLSDVASSSDALMRYRFQLRPSAIPRTKCTMAVQAGSALQTFPYPLTMTPLLTTPYGFPTSM